MKDHWNIIDGREPEELSFGTFLKWTLVVIVAFLAIDFLGMMVWAISGQIPQEGYFIGKISREIIRAIIY